MSEALNTPEQAMIAAVAVICLSLGGDRERRALEMLADVLPAVRAAASGPNGFEATRATEGVRFRAEALVDRGAQGARVYEGLRFDLKRALEDFFEKRAVAAWSRWRGPIPSEG